MGEPNCYKQMLVRDYGVLDNLVHLCSIPFKLSGIAIGKRSHIIITLKQSLKLNYDAIRYAIQEYRPNELYCSQWLAMFIEDTFKNYCDVIEKAEATLKELIDNNEKVLEKRLNEDIIREFIKDLSKDPEPKYIDLLNVLIICNGKPIHINQQRVTKMIMKDQNI